MKTKVFISLLLAVLLVGTLAAPALAGRPKEGEVTPLLGSEGEGKFSVQPTHDGYAKVRFDISKGISEGAYAVQISYKDRVTDDEYGPYNIGEFELNKRGNGHFSKKFGEENSDEPLPCRPYDFTVNVRWVSDLTPHYLGYINWVDIECK